MEDYKLFKRIIEDYIKEIDRLKEYSEKTRKTADKYLDEVLCLSDEVKKLKKVGEVDETQSEQSDRFTKCTAPF
ncbi:MAG: hypothetical protein RSA60_09350 [Eubacterium sp.]